MDIKFSVDDTATLKQLHGLSVDAYMEAWADTVAKLAKSRAREKLGNGDFGNRIARSIKVDDKGMQVDVASDGTDGYIGDAVHRGGTFRARSGKLLAIPIHPLVRKGGAFSSFYPSDIKDKIPTFLLSSKKRNQLFVFRKPAEGEKLQKPLFVLKKTTQHKPRPWWPEPDAVEAATAEFFDENF